MLRYEEMFPKTEEDEALREKIAQDLEDIVERLKMAFSKQDAWQGEYVAGYMCVILDYLLRKYPKTNERMNKIMGRDQVITVPADTLIEKGKVEGRVKGRAEGRVEEKISVIIKKLGKNMPFVQIAREMEMEESDLRPYYDATVAEAPDYSMKAILKKLAALKIMPAVQ